MRPPIRNLLAAGIAIAGLALATAALAAPSTLPRRAVVPHISNADPEPTPTRTPIPPTPRPEPYIGPVTALYVGSANVTGDPIEEGDTEYIGGNEYFEDPSAPPYVMWYPRFGRPGFAAGNTIFAAHVNYVGYGNGPFANLLDADIDDAVYVTMANGEVLTYTVKSVTLHRLADLDMNPVVFPSLDSHTERITLISCGGTFIPAASGYGGEFDSRIILVAERYVP